MNKIKKSFFIGDEWLYYKIFCGYKIADTILIESIKPFTDRLLKEKHIEEWFFIRYDDPSHHLRFRVKISNRENIGFIINLFSFYIKKFLDSHLIWNIQLDTYHREIERYGEKSIEASEGFFFKDSMIITNYLYTYNSEDLVPKEKSKRNFSLRLIDFYLTNFFSSDLEKLEFMTILRNSFHKEFRINNKKQIDDIYLKHKETIHYELKQLPDHRMLIIKPNINIILNLKNEIGSNFNNLVSSFIHMSINRLFYANNRVHELAHYDILWKYYKYKVFSKQI